jgi:4-hydroxybenzoate polyprenyltransferase
MNSRLFWVKIFAFLSLIRWYNIGIASFFAYTAAYFLLKAFPSKWAIISDIQFHICVLGMAFILAAGYIINAFYDAEKDLLDKPQKVLFERFISRGTQIKIYFIFNVIGTLLGLLTHFNVGITFFLMSVGLYFYSHKFQKKAIWGELIASFLTVGSIGWVAIFFEKLYSHTFLYGGFLGLLILIRELIKGIESFEEEKTLQYETIATKWGLKKAKLLITLLWCLLIPLGIWMHYHNPKINSAIIMVECILLISFFGIVGVWLGKNKKHYRVANNYFKAILIISLLAMAIW